MSLIVIACALACERLLSNVQSWRETDWFGRYLKRLQDISLLEPAWLSGAGIALLVPPLLVVAILQGVLQGGFLSVIGLVFSVAVLVLALGPRDLWEEVHALIAARTSGDEEQAQHLALDLATFAGRRPTRVNGQDVLRSVVIQGNERVFGTLLWFFVLGPLGAVLYRMASEFPSQLRAIKADNELIEMALRFHGVLAWVPVRIVALIYGLAGSTDGALAGWRKAQASAADNWVQKSWRLLADTGRGALLIEQDYADQQRVSEGLNDTLREALGLLTRSLIILLAILAAFTIGGWIA